MRVLLRASAYLLPYRLSVVAGVACMLLISATNFAYPQLFRWIIDQGIAKYDWGVIILAIVALVLGTAARGGLNFLQGYISEAASQNVAYDLRNVVYDRMQTLGFSYHDQAQTGQLLTRITNDVETVRRFTGQGLIQISGMIVTTVGTGVILILMNAQLGLITIAMIPVMLLVVRRFLEEIPQHVRTAQGKLAALDSILEENLAGIRVVKGFAREEYEQERYDAANASLYATNVRIIRELSLRTPLILLIGNIGTALIVWFGGHEVIDRSITVGQMVAFLTYWNFLMSPLIGLGSVTSNMARAIASAHRIFEVLDAESDVADRPGARVLGSIDGAIEFRDVCMRYAGSDRHAIRHVSFDVEPGQTLAIVGATGSGKSTIAHLIPRFYDATQGHILVDGHDVRDVTLDSLRRHIGVVLQDTQLFRGTIRENIAFGRPDASFDDVVDVARAAQAHSFILDQPDGYDTYLGEGGTGLSGGQRQRIAIARALLLNPQILILDDSTSSVDAETEYQLQLALDRLIRGRTTVIIAQRMSSVRRADKIIVVDDAEVVAQGSHDDLMETSIIYAQIVSSQLLDDTTLVTAGSGRS